MSCRMVLFVITITIALPICAFILFTGVIGAQSNTVTILMRDACDPDMFNTAVGPNTCVAGQHGTTPFQLFIASYNRTISLVRGGSTRC